MKKIKLLIILFSIFTLTGCYNYRELNDLAITSAIGINKNGDKYEIIAQVVNTQKQGSESNSTGEQPKFVVYKSEGKTIQEALRNIILESPKRLYANHMILLIISEEIAKDGIDNILDIFARDSEFRKQFMVLISRNDNTNDIIGTITALVTLNSKNIRDSIVEDSKYLGISDTINFEDLLDDYLNKRKEILLPSVIMKGNVKKGESEANIERSEPNAKIVLDDLIVFKGSKMIGTLEGQDSINVSFLKGTINDTIYTYKCGDGEYTSIEITNSKTSINTSNKKPAIDIKIKQVATINEVNCKINLQNPDDIKKLEKDIEKSFEKSMLGTINKIVNDYNSDIIGFTEMIYKDHPKYYKELVKKYDDNLLQNIEFKVNVDLTLSTKGNILKGI